MSLHDCEWQMLDLNEWVFGVKIRGIVRKPLGEVYFDEDYNPSWIWFVAPMRHGDPFKSRGACNKLIYAVEEVEKEVARRVRENID